MLRPFIGAVAVVIVTAAAVFAADPPSPSSPSNGWSQSGDRDLADARARIDAKDWAGAAGVMQKAVARDPANADYHNLLAYSIRKGANPDMNLVFKHYTEALRINPKHRGAHEYIGEAYLLVGNLPKAKEHLAALDKLCFLPCEEFTDLKRAIQKYESAKK
jgi:tetratricopeptide (TPR) repeat protein